MTNIGSCKLCASTNIELRASHVVPEFFYKRVYTSKHRFAAIPSELSNSLAVEQKGYRERLFCQSCETKLSRWEAKLSLLINEIVTDTYSSYSVVRTGNILVVNGLDYTPIKLAALSIFWRMSIASHQIFSGYDLGPYAEVFRSILNAEVAPSTSDFPILVSKALLNDVFYPGILFPIGRGRYRGNTVMQSVVLNGVVFDCHMTKSKPIPHEVEKFALQANGRVIVSSHSYDKLGLAVGDFSSRMNDPDVKAFFAKHT